MDSNKVFEVAVKWGTLTVVGATLTWWVNRCTRSALREVRGVVVEVKDTVQILRDVTELPHIAKIIDFAGTMPEDRSFRWEHFFAMARDGRAVVEMLRDVASCANVTSAIALADRAVPAAGANVGEGAAAAPAPAPAPLPADPELVMRQLETVRGISDNIHGIIESPNVGKLVGVIDTLKSPEHLSRMIRAFVLYGLVVIFAIWLAWVFR
mmetsp:Transcript_35652/g.93193  ORF Transcript_35652/g.93193 Transcript_35652/m.93193 type:complete len:210 (-) Transcript_35652:196-825(-)